jgi:hypothetical protein
MGDAETVQRDYPLTRGSESDGVVETPVEAACGGRRDVQEGAGQGLSASDGGKVKGTASASPAPAEPCVDGGPRVKAGPPLPPPPWVSPTRTKKLKTEPVVAPSRHKSRTRSRF